MKKTFLISILCAVMSMTSCKVNWFGETVDAPWYYIAIPVLLIFVIGYAILMSRTYVCPHCKTQFKAKPYHLYVTIHFCGKRMAKCPNCNKKSFCEVKK